MCKAQTSNQHTMKHVQIIDFLWVRFIEQEIHNSSFSIKKCCVSLSCVIVNSIFTSWTLSSDNPYLDDVVQQAFCSIASYYFTVSLTCASSSVGTRSRSTSGAVIRPKCLYSCKGGVYVPLLNMLAFLFCEHFLKGCDVTSNCNVLSNSKSNEEWGSL